MTATTKKSTRLTAKQQKTMLRVRDVLEAHPLGIALDDLANESKLTEFATQQALALIGASQRPDGLWQLSASETSSTPTKADDALSDANADQVINAPAAPATDDSEDIKPTTPNTGREYIELPETGHSIEQAVMVANELLDEEAFELTAPVIKQPVYILIENCMLSLAQDGTGQEPVMAKDVWIDDEGDELDEADCQVMKRAREPYSNEVEFRGVTYRNLFIVNNAQIFHGMFNSIASAHERMTELMDKKPSNIFEVIEV